MGLAGAVAGTLVSTLGFGMFVAAARWGFAGGRPAAGMIVISVLSAIAFVVVIAELWIRPVQAAPLALGLAGQLGALVLFLCAMWAARRRLTLAFSTDAPEFLLECGPYRWMRHPLYAAYALFWLSGAVMTQSAWSLAIATALVAAYIIAARQEEAKFAASPLAEMYSRYRLRAGLMWPIIGERA